MRYASIRSMDISNGDGIGASLFVQGCHRHCDGCFNKETWDFNGGKEWTEKTQEDFLNIIDKPYIKRISILGGEPLDDENVEGVLNLIEKIREKFGNDKKIWLYTGYTWSQIMYDIPAIRIRKDILRKCDIVVDGEFKKEYKDLSLKYRGSSNQRVIDVNKSIYYRGIVLYNTD